MKYLTRMQCPSGCGTVFVTWERTIAVHGSPLCPSVGEHVAFGLRPNAQEVAG